MRRIGSASLFVALMVLLTAPAAAQPVHLEYPEGPALASNRVIGLGGAYAGIGLGADGHLYNPASFASRYNFTTDTDLDWDWTVYWLNVPGQQNPDLYGPPGGTNGTSYLGAAIDLKIHAFGTGLHVYTHDYLLDVGADSSEQAPETVVVDNAQAGIGVAFAVPELDMLFGGYLYGFNWSVSRAVADEDGDLEAGDEILELGGAGTQLGMLWQPLRRPLRVGIVYRPALLTGIREVRDPDFFPTSPSNVYQPTRLTIGASYMLWERQYNPYHTWGLRRFEELSRDEPERTGRRYILLAYDIVFTGASTPQTVSMRSFIQGDEVRAGADTTIGLRAGIESEIIANWLVLRGGGYFEPTRVDPAIRRGRMHGTGGFAFRIPVGELIGFWPWDLRADLAFDLARNFGNVGVGMGFWH